MDNDDQLPISAAEEKYLENLNNKKKKKTKKETKQKTNRDLEKTRVCQDLLLEDQKELEQVKSEVTQIKKRVGTESSGERTAQEEKSSSIKPNDDSTGRGQTPRDRSQ